MAAVTQTQTVANSPLSGYPVGIFKASNGAELQAMVWVDSAGNEITSIPTTSGLSIPDYDYLSVAYPLATQEVYTFKTGGVSGTTVATVTVNYTDATKADLSSVEKT